MAGGVRVEVARIAQVLATMPADTHWLSASECARLDTIRHAGRREQYLAGHWLARQVLATAFGEDAVLLERRSLPPAVQGHEGTRFVSISHGAQWVAAAAADVPVGIDLEQRPRALDASIAALLLEDGEVPGDLDADTLLQRWVAKEAWLKRDGGSALPARLQGMRVSVANPGQADVTTWTHDAFHLAVAIAKGSRIEMQPPLTPGPAFRVWEPL
jgi:4'-phosphopantetheinyl transferase